MAAEELKERVLKVRLVLDKHLRWIEPEPGESGWHICMSSNTDNFNPDTIGNKPKVGFQAVCKACGSLRGLVQPDKKSIFVKR